MASGPVVAMVWEGLDAVKTGRKMLGATNPLASEPGTITSFTREESLLNRLMCIGTIRGDYALAVGRNICHGSDAVESAEKEIALYVQISRFLIRSPRSNACFLRTAGSPRVSSSTSLPRPPGSSSKRTCVRLVYRRRRRYIPHCKKLLHE